MPQLSDTQSILLALAAGRGDGSLLPLPTSITAPAAAVAKSFASLIKRGLAEECETGAADQVHRADGDLRLGLFITSAGRVAIGVEEAVGSTAPAATGDAAVAASPPAPSKQATKASQVLDLLRREEGATLPELVAATGWLPHTTRAALTGLRKKGHALDKSKRGEQTCYRIVDAH